MTKRDDACSQNANTQLGISRRGLLLGTGAAAIFGASLPLPARAASGSIKIGYISPRSGVLSGLLAGEDYMLSKVRAALQPGLTIGGQTYDVEILDRDSQSNPTRAGELAKSLISQDRAGIILSTFTPEMINPVANVCEEAGVPGLFNMCPWEAFYFGRGGKPGQPSPFKWTYLFSFGVAQFAQAYVSQWAKIETNKKVGVLFPNDQDGNGFRASILPLLKEAGYTTVDAGPYENGAPDFSSQIGLFMKEHCEIFTTTCIPADFPVFWRQAALAGYTKIVKIAQTTKSGMSAQEVAGMGALAHRLTSANAWHRDWPYKSPLTGLGGRDLTDGYEKATGNQWNLQLGVGMALFDAATEALKTSGAPNDKAAVAKAISTLKTETINGKVQFGAGPVPNVALMPIVSVQFVKAKSGPFKLDVVQTENAGDPDTAIGGEIVPYSS
jgi:branched-chain amino acid transport system substrate-binding protein